jgi:hypothetical protein
VEKRKAGRPFANRSSEQLRARNLEKVRSYQARHPDRVKATARKSSIKRKFGLSMVEFNEMLLNQECRCAICRIHVSKLKQDIAVDHNHKTGKVRALLCHRCNNILGQAQDHIEILQEAIAYLRRFSEVS